MSESDVHIKLVHLMLTYIKTKYGIVSGYVFTDLPESKHKPPIFDNSRPDLYIINEDLLIIGEAKTECDWDKRHSHDQYRTYMNECFRSDIRPILLVAVPWRVEKSLRSRLMHMFEVKHYAKVEIIVISDMVRF